MLPRGGGAGALEQPGQQAEHARRVAAGRRRLAGGQADLALGHRHPGEAVHHQHDVLAGVAEPLGDPGGDEGGAQPHHRRARRTVATTTTERARPSGPRSFSRNSRTSRPRSPTRAITQTWASVPRAIIDSRLDLPTPEPAKMPMRWPRPQGTSVSSARTPRPSWRVDPGPAHARSGRSPSTPVRTTSRKRRPAVDRPAEAVEHAAEQAPADGDGQRAAGGRHRAADAVAAQVPSGRQAAASPCSATTSASTGPASPSS